MEELRNYIDNEMHSDGDWWDYSNAEKFHEVANTLLSLGMKVEDIKAMLSNLFSAVADEFGG